MDVVVLLQTDRMNLVIHRPNGECIFSHTESEASETLQWKRCLQTSRSKIRMVSRRVEVYRRLEREGLTPRQEEGQVEGGAEASGSWGETEEVLQPPARAGEQAGDLAEYDLSEHSDSTSYEPASPLHAPGGEPMWVNPPPWWRTNVGAPPWVSTNCIPLRIAYNMQELSLASPVKKVRP